ncbi:MAG: hypothetical protein ACI93N_001951 [Flavobacteriaceae bacterium]|jgi:hypothetical protein
MRKNFQIGQRIKVGKVSGTIVRIDNICLTIKTYISKVILLIDKVASKNVEILD